MKAENERRGKRRKTLLQSYLAGKWPKLPSRWIRKFKEEHAKNVGKVLSGLEQFRRDSIVRSRDRIIGCVH
jgi:hypothetical protein